MKLHKFLLATLAASLAGQALSAPAAVAPPQAESRPRARTWTDITGTYSVEAEFAGLSDGQVTLKTKEGKWLRIPLEKLSKSDQRFVRQLALPAGENAPSPAGTGGSAGEQVKLGVTETSLGKVPGDLDASNVAVSADGKRLAYAVSHRIGDAFVVLDGKPGETYDRVGGLQFSPDGKRFVYIAQRRGKRIVVIDGRDGPEFDRILDGTPLFAPVGNRVAYIGIRRGARRGAPKEVIVIDGAEEWEFDMELILTPSPAGPKVAFSPDGSRVACYGVRGKQWFLVVDGTETGPYEGLGDPGAVFSEDSKHVAWTPARGGKCFVVVDGREANRFDQIRSGPVLSPHGKRLAFVFGKGPWMEGVAVDGRPGKTYSSIRRQSIVFNSDGGHVAYIVDDLAFRQSFVVADGRECKKFEQIAPGGATFGLDGRRLAYGARRGHKWYAVVDGTESREYDGFKGRVVFSPDGKHAAYSAYRDNHWFVVVDGVEGKEYDEVSLPIFSPDSSHVAYVALRGGDGWMVVADGAEGKKYRDYRFRLRYTPDSKHVVYSATSASGALGDRMIVVDSVETAPYRDFFFQAKPVSLSDPLRFESEPLPLDSPNSLHFVTKRNDEILAVWIEILDRSPRQAR